MREMRARDVVELADRRARAPATRFLFLGNPQCASLLHHSMSRRPLKYRRRLLYLGLQDLYSNLTDVR
jgi:hypothetical protein